MAYKLVKIVLGSIVRIQAVLVSKLPQLIGCMETPFLHTDLPEHQRELHRFYKAHIMGCVCDLAADVTASVRMKAAQVLCSTAQHARALGDTDLRLRTEGLRREATSTTLQPDLGRSTSARSEEV